MAKIVIEIEETNGSTIGSFVLDTETLKVSDERNVSLADVDGDYIYNKHDTLLRMQLDK